MSFAFDASPAVPAARLTVYFDGACPVCRREIALYQGRPGAEACRWVDAAACAPQALGPGLSRQQALQRFHVRLPDGRLVDGAQGFAALWQVLPGWRWLGRLAAWGPMRPLLAAGYALFLRCRPWWRPAGVAGSPGATAARALAGRNGAQPLSAPQPARAASSVRADEQARFNRLAATWWDASGPMRPLHVLNGLRLGRVLALAEGHHQRAPGTGLAGLRVLDVGCGAGLLSEPLARAGARVTGLDSAGRSIAVAQAHAAAAGLRLDYRCGEPQRCLAAGEQFDLILLLEVVEHVQDMRAFVAGVAAHLAPGGLLIASTLNRTWRSFLLAIVGAEWLLRLLPRGTHRWRQFVTPAELGRAMAAGGLQQQSLTGLRYLPGLHRASWCRSTAVNYLAVYRPGHGPGTPPTPGAAPEPPRASPFPAPGACA